MAIYHINDATTSVRVAETPFVRISKAVRVLLTAKACSTSVLLVLGCEAVVHRLLLPPDPTLPPIRDETLSPLLTPA